MNINFFTSLSLGFCLLLTGCSQSFTEQESDKVVEVRLKPSVVTVEPVSSRSPYEGSETGTSLSALVLKSLVSGNYVTSGVYRESLTFSGVASTGFSVPQYFPSDDSPVYLCALYPADNQWENEVYSNAFRATTVSHVLDGKTDLMASPELGMNKSMFNQTKVATLKFRHLLTKLKVRMVADAGAAFPVEDIWGTVTRIELTKISGAVPPTVATVNLSSGAASFGGSEVSAYPLYCMTGNDIYPQQDVLFVDQALAIPAEATDVAYSLMAPLVPTGTDDLELAVYTSLFPQGISVPVSLSGKSESTAGQYCVLTLTFATGDKPLIQAKAAVTDWQQVVIEGSNVLE